MLCGNVHVFLSGNVYSRGRGAHRSSLSLLLEEMVCHFKSYISKSTTSRNFRDFITLRNKSLYKIQRIWKYLGMQKDEPRNQQ